MSDAEKLAKITRILQIQTDNQNDEEGDANLADAYMAMEAIENVIFEGETMGALRQYEQVGA